MENVPVMISTKDLSYIEDIFNYNFTVCKLIHSFYEKVSDEKIKEFFDSINPTGHRQNENQSLRKRMPQMQGAL